MVMTPAMKQLELGLRREKERDRNHHLGGRSFYFFDFDDNIAVLSTPLILFHKATGEELTISSGEFAKHHHFIGKNGRYENYRIDYDDSLGTFRNFRDHNSRELERLDKKNQVFIDDVAHALGFPEFHWQGPSWNCFYHAVFNQRPLSLITARGHDPQTLLDGIQLFVQSRFIPQEPNYLGIFPVSHKSTREILGDASLTLTVPELKQRAIRKSVELAFEIYGTNPHHRFGMSDDDPKNISMIMEEMTRLKSDYPEVSFFVIETAHGEFQKHEIQLRGIESTKFPETEQLSLW